ncbi:MAG TPA: hypothetical protein PLL69_10505 [Gemmatimonadales bacterium]|nr:hypothetical protein [Gemmatimonadales bacterium]
MRRTLLALSLAALAACGGSSSGPNPPPPPPPPPPGGSSFTATIDGQQWAASPLTISSAANTSSQPGGLLFIGGTLTQPSRGLAIHLGRITGPDTYLLGVNQGTNAGGTLTMTFGSQSWWTALNGEGGTITIQSLANGRMKGIFSADLVPLAGGSTGTVQVRNGEFDLPINPGYAPPAADDHGSSFTMRINNTEDFTGATIVGIGGGTSLIGVTASTDKYTVSLAAGPVDATGTLPIQSVTVPVRKLTVFVNGAAVGYGGTQADVGTMTINSVTAKRMSGSFSATLAQVGGAGSMTVTGNFDVKTAQ